MGVASCIPPTPPFFDQCSERLACAVSRFLLPNRKNKRGKANSHANVTLDAESPLRFSSSSFSCRCALSTHMRVCVCAFSFMLAVSAQQVCRPHTRQGVLTLTFYHARPRFQTCLLAMAAPRPLPPSAPLSSFLLNMLFPTIPLISLLLCSFLHCFSFYCSCFVHCPKMLCFHFILMFPLSFIVLCLL